MAWTKGQSGNPGGRPKDKPWQEALRLALYAEDKKALREIAEKVKELALQGDMNAIKEIGDRLDGKPKQETESSVTLGATQAFIDALKLLNERGPAEVGNGLDQELEQPAALRH